MRYLDYFFSLSLCEDFMQKQFFTFELKMKTLLLQDLQSK